MRVGYLFSPMLLQRIGGLQVQIQATMEAVKQQGAHVEMVDTVRNRLRDYDVVHVFGTMNGNHRIVEAAKESGVPVVLSSLVSPMWNRFAGVRARIAEKIVGRLTDWNVQTTYGHIQRALELADVIIALGSAEKKAVVSGFLIEPSKIRIIPNGISDRFFSADASLFRHHCRIEADFVLAVGTISSYKNQLGIARALNDSRTQIILIGPAGKSDEDYLREVLQHPQVRWLGALEYNDPVLPSAFAAASVLALPSKGEVFPNVVLEALAAGTPVVMTSESALFLPDSEFALRKVYWNDQRMLRREILDLIEQRPARKAVSRLVQDYRWPCIAHQIVGCYQACCANA